MEEFRCNISYIYGVIIAGIIGGVYQLIQIIKYEKEGIALKLLGLWFTFPFYGFIGATLGAGISFAMLK